MLLILALEASQDCYRAIGAGDMPAVFVQEITQGVKEEPQSPGIEKESLRMRCGLEKAVFEGVFAILFKDNRLTLRKERVALPSHSEQFDPAEKY
jgi:hypothetical protein